MGYAQTWNSSQDEAISPTKVKKFQTQQTKNATVFKLNHILTVIKVLV